MFRAQDTPLNIQIVFENVFSSFWTSGTLKPNHFVVFLPVRWFSAVSLYLKKDMSFSQSFLVEHSVIDSKHYWFDDNLLQGHKFKKKFFLFYTFYFLFLKLKLTFFLIPEEQNYSYSIDSIYNNANWLERESSEMYGVYFYFKKDTRKLLLDYSKKDSPMCKDFPTEGVNDFFYNFFESQVSFTETEVVEL